MDLTSIILEYHYQLSRIKKMTTNWTAVRVWFYIIVAFVYGGLQMLASHGVSIPADVITILAVIEGFNTSGNPTMALKKPIV